MKLKIIFFICIFLFITACSQVNETEQESVETEDEAYENSDDIAEGIDDITDNLDEIEQIIN